MVLRGLDMAHDARVVRRRQRQRTAVGTAASLAAMVLIVLSMSVEVGATCSRGCNGQGTCNSDTTCTCFSGFTGGDCSQRTCPTAEAWVAKKDSATHTTAVECAGVGLCDRATGTCSCQVGFQGLACARTKCSSNCNNRGNCISMLQIGSTRSSGTSSAAVEVDNAVGFQLTYTNWEEDNVYGCDCDYGVGGPDCSFIMCPRGDDPKTENNFEYAIKVVATSDESAQLDGEYAFWFNGQSSTVGLDADGSATDTSCESTFESIPGIASAECFGDAGNDDTIMTFHVRMIFEDGYMNNLHFHDGNPSIDKFACNVASVTGGTIRCAITAFDRDMRSNTGGTYSGSGDATFEIVIDDDTSTPNTFKWRKNSGSYTTGVALTSVSTEFDEGVEVVFDSLVGHTVGTTWHIDVVDSGDVINEAVLQSTYKEFAQCSKRGSCDGDTGFCTCFDNYAGDACQTAFTFSNVVDNNPAAQFGSIGSAYIGNLLQLNTYKAAASDFNFMQATANNVPVAYLRGDGMMWQESATFNTAITATGTASLEALTVTSGGETITSGGLTVTAGGVNVADGGLTVTDDASSIGSTSDSDTTLTLTNTNSGGSYGGTVLDLQVTEAAGAGYKMVEMSVNNGGVAVPVFEIAGTGALTVHSGGATVTAGGLGVTAGGLAVADGGGSIVNQAQNDPVLTVSDSLASGLFQDTVVLLQSTVRTKADGASWNLIQGMDSASAEVFRVQGDGKTVISEGGLDVVSGGGTIQAGGLEVAGGETINSGGLHVVLGGATVDDGGVYVDDGGADITQTAIGTIGTAVRVTNDGYTSTALHVEASRKSDPAFKLVQVLTQSETVFEVDGWGSTTLSSLKDDDNPQMSYTRSRSNDGARDTVAQNDVIREHTYSAFGASALQEAAQIRVYVSEATPSDAAMGGTILWRTTEAGSVTLKDRMTLDDAGALQVKTEGVASAVTVYPNGQVASTSAVLDLLGATGAHVRSTANDVDITGATNVDVIATAGDVTLTSTASDVTVTADGAGLVNIDHDADAGTSEIKIGTVNTDTVTVGGASEVDITGAVNVDVVATTGDVTMTATAGDVVITADGGGLINLDHDGDAGTSVLKLGTVNTDTVTMGGAGATVTITADEASTVNIDHSGATGTATLLLGTVNTDVITIGVAGTTTTVKNGLTVEENVIVDSQIDSAAGQTLDMDGKNGVALQSSANDVDITGNANVDISATTGVVTLVSVASDVTVTADQAGTINLDFDGATGAASLLLGATNADTITIGSSSTAVTNQGDLTVDGNLVVDSQIDSAAGNTLDMDGKDGVVLGSTANDVDITGAANVNIAATTGNIAITSDAADVTIRAEGNGGFINIGHDSGSGTGTIHLGDGTTDLVQVDAPLSSADTITTTEQLTVGAATGFIVDNTGALTKALSITTEGTLDVGGATPGFQVSNTGAVTKAASITTLGQLTVGASTGFIVDNTGALTKAASITTEGSLDVGGATPGFQVDNTGAVTKANGITIVTAITTTGQLTVGASTGFIVDNTGALTKALSITTEGALDVGGATPGFQVSNTGAVTKAASITTLGQLTVGASTGFIVDNTGALTKAASITTEGSLDVGGATPGFQVDNTGAVTKAASLTTLGSLDVGAGAAFAVDNTGTVTSAAAITIASTITTTGALNVGASAGFAVDNTGTVTAANGITITTAITTTGQLTVGSSTGFIVDNTGALTKAASITTEGSLDVGGATPGFQVDTTGAVTKAASLTTLGSLDVGAAAAFAVDNTGTVTSANGITIATAITTTAQVNSPKLASASGSNLALETAGTNSVIVGDGGDSVGFFGSAGTTKQVSGSDFTNSVSAGSSTNDQVDDWSDLSTYSNDATAIRNAVHQLARKVKQLNDGLRAYGMFT